MLKEEKQIRVIWLRKLVAIHVKVKVQSDKNLIQGTRQMAQILYGFHFSGKIPVLLSHSLDDLVHSKTRVCLGDESYWAESIMSAPS